MSDLDKRFHAFWQGYESLSKLGLGDCPYSQRVYRKAWIIGAGVTLAPSMTDLIEILERLT